MTEQIHFTYESVGNLCKLLVTIVYEKTHTPREITVFHQRFDRNESDELIEQFLMELYPDGANVGEEEIQALVSHIEQFMLKDKETQDLFVKYDKQHYPLWVYFKPDNKVYKADFAKHAQLITDICCDFFKGFSENEINSQYIKKFIIENFEICSNNSTVEQIAKDCKFIARCILLDERRDNNG